MCASVCVTWSVYYVGSNSNNPLSCEETTVVGKVVFSSCECYASCCCGTSDLVARSVLTPNHVECRSISTCVLWAAVEALLNVLSLQHAMHESPMIVCPCISFDSAYYGLQRQSATPLDEECKDESL